MAQILDLSKRFTTEQIESASQENGSVIELPADGYVCTIVQAILNDDSTSGKANIELHVDIVEGEYAGYFKRLEDRYGFWRLRGWMSFKESNLAQFQRTCIAICNSNPGLKFNPFAPGGVDVDILNGKKIGVVTRKEEYRNNSGDLRVKDTIYYFMEVDKVKNKKFKVPELKKLKDSFDPTFIPASSDEQVPFFN